MNSALLINIARFILLIALQILLFNNINFLGYINPYPYILFIILYPANSNKTGLLVASFLLGLTVDMFCNSGGVHAAAILILAFVRPSIFKFSFGLSYEYQTVKIADKISPERITLLLLAIFIHHFVMFFFEYFALSYILEILIKTAISSVFTILLSILIIYLVKPNRR
mgnify:CR=1 FL=1